MKKIYTCLVILLFLPLSYKKAFSQVAMHEISVHSGILLYGGPNSNNFLQHTALYGFSFGALVLFPIGRKINIGPELNSDLLKCYPFLYWDIPSVNLWMHSLDGKAKYRLIQIDSDWSVYIHGELGLTFMDPLKKNIDNSLLLHFPLNNKYGFNMGGGLNLELTISSQMHASLFANYRFIKILTKDKDYLNESIVYDSYIISPGIDITYLF